MNSSCVSILIPCHNAEKYVAATIESILNQTWPNKEIVVVDDGSTDQSWAVLEGYAKRGVKIFRHEKHNAAATRNRALQEASGEFIKFFDADDLMDPPSIELQMARLGDSKTAVASAEWGRFCGDDLSTFRLTPQNVWKDMNSLDWLVEAWMDARPMMQPGLFLLPRQLVEQCGPWNEQLTLIDDFEYYARVLSHASEVRFTPGARLYYRSGLSGSLSGRKSRKAVESAWLSLVTGTAHLLSRRGDAQARLACGNLLQDFIYTYYPAHNDLCARMAGKVAELGGSNLPPSGPPRFQALRKWVGWKLARRVQHLAGE